MPISLQSNFAQAWRILWLVSGALFIGLVLAPLLRQGMFLDGVTYAAIAKNLSLNHGTLWQPFYSETVFPVFYEHPPFAIYLESLFFRVLGEQYPVENVYSFCVIVGQIALIAWYWLRKEKLTWHYLAILLLVWMLVPLNTRVFTNNMLESTLTLFTTAASFLLLCPTKNRRIDLAYLFGASIAILLGLLSNGPTAFFPVVIPVLVALVGNSSNRVISGMQRSLRLIGILTLVLTTFYLICPAAWQNTQQYIQSQLMPSVLGDRLPVYNHLKHFHVIYLYCRAIGCVMAFAVICIAIAARLQQHSIGQDLRKALSQPQFLFFFYLSLLASLPA